MTASLAGDPLAEEVQGAELAAARSALAWRGLLRRLRGQLAVSAAVLGIWVVLIAAAPLLSRYGPLTQNLGQALRPPSAGHYFGTDALGRDVFARVLYGGRTTVPAAVAVVAFGFVVGTLLGLIAGYAGGLVDEAIMRVTDLFLAFPVIILAMAVSAALGGGITQGVVALAAVWWPQYTRVCRSLVIETKGRDYVLASRAVGRTRTALLLRVILPNMITPLVTLGAFDIGRGILNFAVLGFLGLGAQPPAPEWGSMIADGSLVMGSWWVATFPALAVLTITLALNFVGDSVRDAIDPRSAVRA
jgi:peptide/nickel transport system permease protein